MKTDESTWRRVAIRIASICLISTSFSMPITVYADYFINGEGKEQPFCEAILTALNKSKPTQEKGPCISEEILKLPGVTDPAWERLDLSQHEELAKKLYVLNSVGSQEYFRSQKLMPQMYPSPEDQKAFLDGVKKLGAELFVLRLPAELSSDRALVTLRFKNDLCGRPSQLRGESDKSAWVTSDLKEIATGPGLFNSRAARPLMYRKRLYLVRPYGTDDALEVFVPRSATLIRVCNISFTSEITFREDKK